jgi:predicted MFS family arabinose efflux permease
MLVTVQGLSLIAALFLLGPLLARVRISVPYFASVGCASLAMLLLGSGRSMPVLMLGAVALAAGAALIHLVNMLRLAETPLPKSKISSLLNLAGQGGSLVGSVAGGLLSAMIGLQHVFLAWLPLIWAAALFCLWRFHLARWKGAAS